jgi:hypothetical protein
MNARGIVTSLAAAAPTLPPAAQDIRDIRGPIAIPSVWPVLLMVAGGILLLAALGAATYWLVRRIRKIRTKTVDELALERLERARALARDGRVAELAVELSDAVCEYVEARFQLRAAYRTTEEFLHDLLTMKGSPVAAHRDRLGEFLGACDLAKFARFALDVEQMQAMIDAAQAFVKSTCVQPDAPAPVSTGGIVAREVRA